MRPAFVTARRISICDNMLSSFSLSITDITEPNVLTNSISYRSQFVIFSVVFIIGIILRLTAQLDGLNPAACEAAGAILTALSGKTQQAPPPLPTRGADWPESPSVI
ncbi:hypothetical protein XENOCAPTIV_014179 [Xenoophorus captivus]|uniref:Uncharacterized protein n=1 Tax=Xenoophorus captivus TaxID=1517983 RepID=A0ABV0RJ13_9TELE